MNPANEYEQLVGCLTHELAQPLAATLSNAQVASRLAHNTPLDLDEIKRALADIIEDNRKACSILNHVRSVVERHPAVPHPVDLNKVVEDTVAIVQSTTPLTDIRVCSVLSAEAVLVRGDEVPLQQVLRNLIVNAIDSIEQQPAERKIVTVRTSFQSGDQRGVLTVEDEGPGVPEELAGSLFAPFFTTKKGRLGTGLAICSTIVSSLGGSIDFQNRSGRGASFQVKLPLASSEDVDS